jgi:hypothetical protein
MADVQPIAQSSAAVGTELPKELGSLKLTLPGLQAKLEEWSRQQQQNYDAALRLVPPAPLQAAHQEVLATLQLRAIGLTNLANTLAVAGSKPAFQVAAALAKQANLLSASDLVWADLFKLPATETMRRLGVNGVIAPASNIVPNAEVISANSFEKVYARLKSTNTSGKVTGIHGSELVSTEAVSGGQTKTLSTSTPTTVNVAADLVFKVSFKDSGNFQEVKIPVTLTVSVFGKTKASKTKTVLSISKGQTATVDFGNLDLQSAFSGQATVRVKIGKVPGETNLANNQASYQVFFSLSSNG